MGRKRIAKRRDWPPGLGMNNSGYYYYVNPLSKKKHGLGHDRAKAMSEARAANAYIATLGGSSLVDKISGVVECTLKDWVPKYKAAWIKQSKPAEETLRCQKGYLERIEACSIAWMPLPDITTVHIASLLEQFEQESGVATARLVRVRLSDMFRMAITKGLIEAGMNPVSSTYKPDYEVLRERLSLEQFLQIRAGAKRKSWLVNAMNLALLSAQRREDVATMKFTDERDDYLFVVQSKSQGVTRLQLDVNIRLEAIDMSLRDVIKQCRDNFVSPYMIHHSTGRGRGKTGGSVSLNALTNAFAGIRDEVGIVATEGRTPPSFHEIRSLSERLYKKEYGAEFAQAMLGHKHAKMTADYDDLRGSGWQVVGAKG